PAIGSGHCGCDRGLRSDGVCLTHYYCHYCLANSSRGLAPRIVDQGVVQSLKKAAANNVRRRITNSPQAPRFVTSPTRCKPVASAVRSDASQKDTAPGTEPSRPPVGKGCHGCLDRKNQCDCGLMIEPGRLLEEPVAQRYDSGLASSNCDRG